MCDKYDGIHTLQCRAYLISDQFEDDEDDLLPDCQGAEIYRDKSGSGCAADGNIQRIDEFDVELPTAGPEDCSPHQGDDDAEIDSESKTMCILDDTPTMRENEGGKS